MLYTIALGLLVKRESSSTGPALVGWAFCFGSGDALNSKGGEKACLEASVGWFDWNGGFEEKKSERRY